MSSKYTLALIACALLAAGCAKKPTTVEMPATSEPVPAAGAETSGAGTGAGGDVRALPDEGPAGGGVAAPTTVFYFDFDSSDVRAEYQAALGGYGRQLAADRNARVRLEGHTDERGSREYNIALGERRAQAVRRALLLAGAGDAQVTTVSMGEEKPAAEGSDEAAWSKNRRVELSLTR